MLLGLGLPEWLVILGLVGGLFLTFWVMAKGSVAYERARQRRQAEDPSERGSERTGERT